MSASDELHDRRDKGWFHIDHALIEAYGPRVGAIGIAVYTYLVHKADRAGNAWPSYNTIAAGLGLSRPTAIKTIRELAACGLIRVEVVRPAGKRAHNVYTLVTIGKADLPVNDVYQSGIGKGYLPVKDVAPIGKADLPVLVKHVDPIKNHQSTTKEQEPIKRGRAYSPAFEAAWEAYGRKGAKGDAWTQYQKQSGEGDVILDAIPVYLATRRVAEGYKLDFERFLSRRIWENPTLGEENDAPRRGPPTKGDRKVGAVLDTGREFDRLIGASDGDDKRPLQAGNVPAGPCVRAGTERPAVARLLGPPANHRS